MSLGGGKYQKRSTDMMVMHIRHPLFQLPNVKQYLEASQPREKECFTAVQMIRKYLTQGNIGDERGGGGGGAKKETNYIFDSIHEVNIQALVPRRL